MSRFRKIAALFGRARRDAEMSEEMRLHLEHRVEENLANGMSSEEARYAALRRFGGVEQAKEQVREQRAGVGVENLFRDARLTLRGLVRAPGFALGVVATLGLGLGLSTSFFGLVDLATRAPLRVPEPETLVRGWSAGTDGRTAAPTLSWAFYRRLAERSTAFDGMGASIPTGFAYQDGENVQSIGGTRVTSSLLTTLGAPLLRGRLFTAAEEAPGGPPVVLLAPGFWRSAFGGRDEAIGATLELDGVPHEIVGVIAETVAQLDPGNSVLLPRPFDLPGATTAAVERGRLPVQVTLRLRPGVGLEQANAELQRAWAAYRQDFPDNVDVARTIHLRSYVEEVSGMARPAVWILMAAAGCVLLIAASNAGGLILTRTLHRRHQVAVRLALGANAFRVSRALVGEVFVLTFVAAAVGLAVAHAAMPALDHFARPFLPRLPVLAIEGRAWLFAGGATAAIFLMLAAIPLVQVRRIRVDEALRPSRTVAGGGRVQGSLVALQVAITSALLLASAVLLTSYRRLGEVSPGFDPSGLATGFVNLPEQQYPTPERQAAFFNDALARIAAMDPTLEVAAVSAMPLTRPLPGAPYRIAGQPAPPENAQPLAIQRGVSDDYFRVLRIPLREGRAFLPEDRAGGRTVGILNESFAKRLFGAESAVGQVLQLAADGRTSVEIVGVVGDVRANGLTAGATDEIYRPLMRGSQAAFVVRSAQEPAKVRATLARAVSAIDRQRAIAVFQTADQILTRTASAQRLMAWTTGIFATAAVGLAAVGVYALIACWVAQRTREFAVRMALGADRPSINRLVVRQGMKLVLAGVSAGAAIYVVASGTLRSVLFGVTATDPLAIGLAGGGLTAVALFACWLPARRAGRMDPASALRSE